ncbi:MAG: ISAs1 family transposase [Thermodesulfobacteriota bacterium]
MTDKLSGYLAFPHAHLAFRIERTVRNLDGSLRHQETKYGISSLPELKLNTAQYLQKRVRQHWTIENRLHWVRDVTYDEDRNQTRTKNGPQVMATLRNLAISLLRLAGAVSIAKAIRYCLGNLRAALRLLGIKSLR